jgi:two-component system chemotaxis sensor kinase CheA
MITDEISETSTVADRLGTYIIDVDHDILSEFIAEATDQLNTVEGLLLKKEGDFSLEDVDTLFRGVHSIKGTSSFFNLLEIKESSHTLENLLDEVRAGVKSINQELKSLVLRYIDIQHDLLDTAKMAAQQNGKVERSSTVQTLIKDIENCFNHKGGDPTNIRENKISTAIYKKNESLPKSFVKIDIARLNSLENTIEQLIQHTSILINNCREISPHDETIIKTNNQVEQLTKDLKDIERSMRFSPINILFQKLSRLAWDMSRTLGKEIEFIVHGEQLELDRNLIEQLTDPLMHMIRNALDHGIEDPETREAIGKHRTGKIELTSTIRDGNIVIKIKDDGQGLDSEKLLKKAIELGIVSKDLKLTESEILEIIFAPGFSTVEKITDISGRGVGMDIVMTNIKGLQGEITIDSLPGQGCTFTIKLPLKAR